MNLWILMLACGVVTFCIRYSFIAAEGLYRPPPWFRRLLPFVPIAALTALVAPEMLLVKGQMILGGDNPRLWAGLVAIVAAALWRNTLLTIGAGFVALFLIQRL